MDSLAGRGIQAELIYALLGLTGEVIRLEKAAPNGGRRFTVAASVSDAEREVILRCVEPGAVYAACQAEVELMLLSSSSSCARSAVAWAAVAVLEEYADSVASAEAELADSSELVEGPSRLANRLGHWSETLSAVLDAVKTVRARSLRGGQVVDWLRRTCRASVGRRRATMSRIAARAEGLVLRQLCVWCTSGEVIDPCGDFFIRVEGMRCSTANELVPETMLSAESIELALFAGGALRVVRQADRRWAEAARRRKLAKLAGLVEHASAETKFEPSAEVRSLAIERWATLTRKSTTRKFGRAVDAAAEEVQLDRELAALIHDAEAEAASSLLGAVNAAGIDAATRAVCGVALLRCGALWQRAIHLARPRLVSALPDDDAALVIQGALEEAARDLVVGGGGDLAAPQAILVAADRLEEGWQNNSESFVHAVCVICDPEGFEFLPPLSQREISARYNLSHDATWSTADSKMELINGASLSTKAPRRLKGRAWSIHLAFGRHEQATTACLELGSLAILVSDRALAVMSCSTATRLELGSEQFLTDPPSELPLEIVIDHALDRFHGDSKWRLDVECKCQFTTVLAAVSLLVDNLMTDSPLRVSVNDGGRLSLHAFSFQPSHHKRTWSRSLRIEVAPAWPLTDLFFEADAIATYDACFERLFVARISAADLDDAWLALNSTRLCRRPDTDRNDTDQRRRLWSLHARTAHLARAIADWLARDVVEPRCVHLDRLKLTTFAALRRAHADFRLGLKQALLVQDAMATESLEGFAAFAADLVRFLKTHAVSSASSSLLSLT